MLGVFQPARRRFAGACYPDRPQSRIFRSANILAAAAMADRGIRIGPLASPHSVAGARFVRWNRGGRVSHIFLTLIADGELQYHGPDFGKASPMGLLVIVLLLVATLLLLWSMNRQLKKIPASFDSEHPELDQAADEGTELGGYLDEEPSDTDRNGPSLPPEPGADSG
uniref:U1740e n=1 Tax=Mycobacterium leprae TaxID=1769 RepID=Q50061_MYCLR|nr:u1740e [Mycobacterium leprae]